MTDFQGLNLSGTYPVKIGVLSTHCLVGRVTERRLSQRKNENSDTRPSPIRPEVRLPRGDETRSRDDDPRPLVGQYGKSTTSDP